MDLPTYTNIWRIEKRLYKLYDLRLPMPLPIVWIGVFLGVLAVWTLFLRLLRVPFETPWHVLFLVPPGVVTWLSTRPVIESKRLTELLQSQLRYLGEPRTWCRMAPAAEPDQIRFEARVWRRSPGAAPALAGKKAKHAGGKASRANARATARAAAKLRARGGGVGSPARRPAAPRPTPPTALPAALPRARGDAPADTSPRDAVRPAPKAAATSREKPVAKSGAGGAERARAVAGSAAETTSGSGSATSATSTTSATPAPPRKDGARPGAGERRGVGEIRPAVAAAAAAVPGANPGRASDDDDDDKDARTPADVPERKGLAWGDVTAPPASTSSGRNRSAASAPEAESGTSEADETGAPASGGVVRILPVPGPAKRAADGSPVKQAAARTTAEGERLAAVEADAGDEGSLRALPVSSGASPAEDEPRGEVVAASAAEVAALSPVETGASDGDDVRVLPVASPAPRTDDEPRVDAPAAEHEPSSPAGTGARDGRGPVPAPAGIGSEALRRLRRLAASAKSGVGEEPEPVLQPSPPPEPLPMAAEAATLDAARPKAHGPEEEGAPTGSEATAGPVTDPMEEAREQHRKGRPPRLTRPQERRRAAGTPVSIRAVPAPDPAEATNPAAPAVPAPVARRFPEPKVRRVESVVGRDTSGGWRRLAQVVVGTGTARTDGSEIDEARARSAISTSKRIVVLGCTGGAGQTTTALMLGHTLATYREDRVLAIDANNGDRTLSHLISAESPETLTSLLAGLDEVSGYLSMRAYTTRCESGLEVIAADGDEHATQRLADRSALSDQRLAEAIRMFDRHYKLILIDPAAAVAARVLPYADQLILVAPASADAPDAIAMTYEWLDGHGCSELRRRAVMVVNGVSRRSMDDVEQAEAVASGRCRAIVRVPWEEELAPGGPGPVDLGHLRTASRRAYVALAGVVASGLGAERLPLNRPARVANEDR